MSRDQGRVHSSQIVPHTLVRVAPATRSCGPQFALPPRVISAPFGSRASVTRPLSITRVSTIPGCSPNHVVQATRGFGEFSAPRGEDTKAGSLSSAARLACASARDALLLSPAEFLQGVYRPKN